MGHPQGRRRNLTPRSLTARLSLTLAVSTLAVATVAGAWSYHQAFQEAQALQDDVLRQVGAIVATSPVAPEDLTTDLGPLTDTASDLDVTSLSASGLADTSPAGLTTTTVGGEVRRVLVVQRLTGGPVAVSQPTGARDEIAHATALSTVLPLVALIPVLLVVIVLGVRGVLRPVNRLADDIGGRDARDLGPVDVDAAPTELHGFLLALNAQLARTQHAVDHERLFIAQAAHELRTPLTAMSLQLENAVAASDEAHVRARLAELRGGVGRSRHLIDQLLELARAQADSGPATTEGFDSVLRHVLGEVLPLADLRGVTLEVRSGAALHDPVPTPATTSVLRNLLDNAVRYSPAGATVTVDATRAAGILAVTVGDDGPGIGDPEAAVRPFTREGSQQGLGSGLGLAIVTELVRHVGGTLRITSSTRPPTGTSARVELPVPTPTPNSTATPTEGTSPS
ncbi:MAG TPA: ATP-binding protein [Ornithinibacter sp.]|nr:ATP-binding protein [Ornithinibacter sp.]